MSTAERAYTLSFSATKIVFHIPETHDRIDYVTKELKKGEAKGDSAERTITFHRFDIYEYVDLDDGSVLSNKDKLKVVLLTPSVAETQVYEFNRYAFYFSKLVDC